MCTLDTNVRLLFEEIDLILGSGDLAGDIPRLNVMLRLLRENPDILNSLENFRGVVWYFSYDGFVEFMPNSSYLILISLRDLSFQVYLEDEVFLVGDSDYYLQGYKFYKDCPFFSDSDGQTNYALEEFSTAVHQVSAA